MQVYRVENSDGMGPYTASGQIRPKWNATDFLGPRHPPPEDDERLWPWLDLASDERDAFSFGFSSVASFLHWFHERQWLNALADAGYSLNVYEVHGEWVMLGSSQCVFLKDKATSVGKYADLRELALTLVESEDLTLVECLD